MPPEATEILNDVPLAEIALGIILGVLGWPLYAGFVRVAGALVGLAAALAGTLVLDEFHPLGEYLVLALVLAAIVGALIGIWLIRRLVLVVWLLMGASLGVLSVWAADYQLAAVDLDTLDPVVQVAVWAGAALVAALLTVWLRRWLVIVTTSALGAALIAPHLESVGPPLMAWWSGATVGFIAIQVGLHRAVGLAEIDEEEED